MSIRSSRRRIENRLVLALYPIRIYKLYNKVNYKLVEALRLSRSTSASSIIYYKSIVKLKNINPKLKISLGLTKSSNTIRLSLLLVKAPKLGVLGLYKEPIVVSILRRGIAAYFIKRFYLNFFNVIISFYNKGRSRLVRRTLRLFIYSSTNIKIKIIRTIRIERISRLFRLG
ncbi:hypothetical protein LZ32DRAFT_623056 [Colletotrichum eremochloae]|nr:hypothetical protein LZ32DRAFT_623056 [Colletotrichum eremochloae]